MDFDQDRALDCTTSHLMNDLNVNAGFAVVDLAAAVDNFCRELNSLMLSSKFVRM